MSEKDPNFRDEHKKMLDSLGRGKMSSKSLKEKVGLEDSKDKFHRTINDLLKAGLIARENGEYSLTPKGLQFSKGKMPDSDVSIKTSASVLEIFEKFGQVGLWETLKLLYNKDQQRQPQALTLALLAKELDIHQDYVHDALQDLVDSALAEKQSKGVWTISDTGRLFLAEIEKLKTILASPEERRQREFLPITSEQWETEAGKLIISARNELLMTTKSAAALENPNFKPYAEWAFLKMSRENVKVRLIADARHVKPKIHKLLREYQVDTRFVPFEVLGDVEIFKDILHPPVKDFSHIFISDRLHWLYTERNSEGGNSQTGYRCYHDPYRASRFASLFELIWSVASNDYENQRSPLNSS